MSQLQARITRACGLSPASRIATPRPGGLCSHQTRRVEGLDRAQQRCCTAAAVGTSTPRVTPHCQPRHSRTQVSRSSLPHRHVLFFGRDEPSVEFSVVKLQVGLFGDIPKLQRLLDRVADTDTSDEEGLHDLLRDSSLILLDRLQYSAYGQLRNKGCEDIDDAEEFFSRASMEERSKFKDETLTNVDGLTRKRSFDGTGDMLDTWLCVTLLVAIEGELKFPKVQSLMELKRTLEMFRSLLPEDLVAVELLWTPQASGDAYTRDELLADFPALMTLT